MTTYTINYDLRAPGRNYQGLFDEIARISSKRHHTMDSLWIVESSKSAAEIRDALKNKLDSNDMLLVVSVGSQWASWKVSQASNDQLRAA